MQYSTRSTQLELHYKNTVTCILHLGYSKTKHQSRYPVIVLHSGSIWNFGRAVLFPVNCCDPSIICLEVLTHLLFLKKRSPISQAARLPNTKYQCCISCPFFTGKLLQFPCYFWPKIPPLEGEQSGRIEGDREWCCHNFPRRRLQKAAVQSVQWTWSGQQLASVCS